MIREYYKEFHGNKADSLKEMKQILKNTNYYNSL